MKQYYTFDDPQRAIRFDRFDMPTPWINYLSNGQMHAFVSQAGGGMTWWRSPIAFRLTRYRFYNLPMDTPGYYLSIRTEDGTVWSPTFRPCNTPVDSRQAMHQPGVSTFTATKNGLTATLRLFMAMDVDALVWQVTLTNEMGEAVNCDLFAYVELSQFLAKEENTLGYYLKWNARAVYDEQLQAITYAYTAWMHPKANLAPLVYFGGDCAADSYCCNRDTFCGAYRDESNPAEPLQGRLSNTKLQGGEPCGALHKHQTLAAHETKSFCFYLGAVKGALSDYEGAMKEARAALALLRADGGVDAQWEKAQAWWQEHLSVYQCQLPDAAAQRQVNTWNPLQCVHTARYSRSISAAASGVRGVGFRDSAQDLLAQACRKPEWALSMLEYLASQQFADGHPVHIMWPEEGAPAQDITRSDNHLWLVYLAYAIAAETGDVSFLDKEVPFLAEDKLSHSGSASLWEHLVRGIHFTEQHMGEHGLPLILFSDWNDHLGPFGRKGKGESIMVAQQLIYALRQMTELAGLRGDEQAAAAFAARIDQQKQALAQYAWDGRWYLRGLDDEGQPIGSQKADHMRVWLNPQSWMVLADAADKAQMETAMDNAEQELATGLGLLLNAPGFPSWPEKGSEMVNGLPAGYSENGGVFCQANCWAIIAEALLGRGDRAWELYKQLIPHEIVEKIGVGRYRAEPYAYCSTLLGKANEQFGWGVVSQVTGTAAWMDVAVTQYLLGVRPTLHGLLIDPSIPAAWDGFAVQRKYRSCALTIVVENSGHVQHGVQGMTVNGKIIDVSNGAFVTEEMLKGLTAAQIRVTMG